MADPQLICNLTEGKFPPIWVDIRKQPASEWKDRLLAADTKETDGIFAKDAVVEVPEDAVPEGTQILNILTQRKLKKNGTIKSRHCLNGKHMRKGVHFDRSYSPTLQHTSMRALAAVAAELG